MRSSATRAATPSCRSGRLSPADPDQPLRDGHLDDDGLVVARAVVSSNVVRACAAVDDTTVSRLHEHPVDPEIHDQRRAEGRAIVATGTVEERARITVMHVARCELTTKGRSFA